MKQRKNRLTKYKEDLVPYRNLYGNGDPTPHLAMRNIVYEKSFKKDQMRDVGCGEKSRGEELSA